MRVFGTGAVARESEGIARSGSDGGNPTIGTKVGTEIPEGPAIAYAPNLAGGGEIGSTNFGKAQPSR